MVVADSPKIFDVPRIRGRIFLSLEKFFLKIFLHGKCVTRTFFDTFFEYPYHSNDTNGTVT